MDAIRTLQQAVQYFSNYENCKTVMVQLRWPDGVVKCPQCGSDHVAYLAKARVWKCYEKHSLAKFSLKTGTIFEDSPLGLDKWLPALWLVVNCKNGVSSCETARDLGVTQKTAWFMNHRIRFALHRGRIGPAFRTSRGRRNLHRRQGPEHACSAFAPERSQALAERIRPPSWASWSAAERCNSRVRVKIVDNTKKKTLQREVREHVEAGSAILHRCSEVVRRSR